MQIVQNIGTVLLACIFPANIIIVSSLIACPAKLDVYFQISINSSNGARQRMSNVLCFYCFLRSVVERIINTSFAARALGFASILNKPNTRPSAQLENRPIIIILSQTGVGRFQTRR